VFPIAYGSFTIQNIYYFVFILLLLQQAIMFLQLLTLQPQAVFDMQQILHLLIELNVKCLSMSLLNYLKLSSLTLVHSQSLLELGSFILQLLPLLGLSNQLFRVPPHLQLKVGLVSVMVVDSVAQALTRLGQFNLLGIQTLLTSI
jgi:hypothetical protein